MTAASRLLLPARHGTWQLRPAASAAAAAATTAAATAATTEAAAATAESAAATAESTAAMVGYPCPARAGCEPVRGRSGVGAGGLGTDEHTQDQIKPTVWGGKGQHRVVHLARIELATFSV